MANNTARPSFTDIMSALFSITSIIEFLCVAVLWSALTLAFYGWLYGAFETNFRVEQSSTCRELGEVCTLNSGINVTEDGVTAGEDIIITAVGPIYMADFATQTVKITVKNDTNRDQIIPITVRYISLAKSSNADFHLTILDDDGRELEQDTFTFKLTPYSSKTQVARVRVSDATNDELFEAQIAVFDAEFHGEEEMRATFNRMQTLRSFLSTVFLVPPGSNVFLLIVTVLFVKVLIEWAPRFWEKIIPQNILTLVAFIVCLFWLTFSPGTDAAFWSFIWPFMAMVLNSLIRPYIVNWPAQGIRNHIRNLLMWFFKTRGSTTALTVPNPSSTPSPQGPQPYQTP